MTSCRPAVANVISGLDNVLSYRLEVLERLRPPGSQSGEAPGSDLTLIEPIIVDKGTDQQALRQYIVFIVVIVL